MTALNKQALRQLAEKATPGPWEMEHENIWFRDAEGYTKHLMYAYQGDDVDDQQDHDNTAYIAAFNPKVVLALLDDLEVAIDACNGWQGKYAEADERLRAAESGFPPLTVERLIREKEGLEKRIAELEAREVNLPKLSVGEVMHMSGFSRDYAEGWCAGNDNAIHEIRAAGIGVKQQEGSVDSDVGSRNQPGMVVAVHIDAGDFVKVRGQVFEVEETDFDDHDVTLRFVGGNALKCAAGCQVEVVAAPVDAGIGVKGY